MMSHSDYDYAEYAEYSRPAKRTDEVPFSNRNPMAIPKRVLPQTATFTTVTPDSCLPCMPPSFRGSQSDLSKPSWNSISNMAREPSAMDYSREPTARDYARESTREFVPRDLQREFGRDYREQRQMGSKADLEPVLSALEPIEAGSFTKIRRKSTNCLAEEPVEGDFLHPFKRPGICLDNMTDEEREEAQRLKRKDEAFKTALCDAYKRSGMCSYGEGCRFAHGEHELRLPAQPRGKSHPKYKTQLCDKFSMYGVCPYGQRCQFIHKLRKGLPLVEYERLLSHGQISPARDGETHLVDVEPEKSPVKSGWQPLRLDVPPPALLQSRGKNIRYGCSHPRREKVDLPFVQPDMRAPVPKMAPNKQHRGGTSFFPPEMNQDRSEQELAFERAFREAAYREEVERLEYERRTMMEKRRRMEEEMFNLQPALNRSASLQALSDSQRGTRSSNVRDVPVDRMDNKRKVAAPCDLSLITEEPEERDNVDNMSYRMRIHKAEKEERRHSNGTWQEMLFGKKLATIPQEDEEEELLQQEQEYYDRQLGEDEPLPEVFEKTQANQERELLVQSCDEELLAAGLYDDRYPDHRQIIMQWGLQN